MCSQVALVYLAELSFKVSASKASRLVATIKVLEIVANIYTVNPLKDVVMFQQKVAQKVDGLTLIEHPIW
jgi:hypothetical protein